MGEITRPFRYDLNQIPYDYRVEVMNRLKELHLINRVPKELCIFITLYRRQWPKSSQRKRNAKKAKWLSEEALQIVEERREAKSKREGERYTQLNAEFQKVAMRDQKPSSMNSAKKQGKTTEWERVEISSRKLKVSKKYFVQGWAW